MTDTVTTSNRGPTRIEELKFLLLHGGARDEAIAQRVIDLAVAEVQAEYDPQVARLANALQSVMDEIARFGIYGPARTAAAALVRRADELVAENATLRGRIAELEAAQAPTGEYPPTLPWVALMDHDDRHEFLGELASVAIDRYRPGTDDAATVAEIEKVCGTWRLIAEAQHAHNTAPGPDLCRTCGEGLDDENISDFCSDPCDPAVEPEPEGDRAELPVWLGTPVSCPHCDCEQSHCNTCGFDMYEPPLSLGGS